MIVVLRETYAKCKSQKEVAQTLGVGSATITAWKKELRLREKIVLVKEKC